MRSNLQVSFFDLKVRHRGSQPSIFVRSFRSFTIDALSFLVSAGSLVLITTSFNTTPDGRQAPTRLRQDIVEGLRYVLKHPILSWLTLLLLLVNFILPTSVRNWCSSPSIG